MGPEGGAPSEEEVKSEAARPATPASSEVRASAPDQGVPKVGEVRTLDQLINNPNAAVELTSVDSSAKELAETLQPAAESAQAEAPTADPSGSEQASPLKTMEFHPIAGGAPTEDELTPEEVESWKGEASRYEAEAEDLLRQAREIRREGGLTNEEKVQKDQLMAQANQGFELSGDALLRLPGADNKRNAADLYARAGLPLKQADALLSTELAEDRLKALVELLHAGTSEAIDKHRQIFDSLPLAEQAVVGRQIDAIMRHGQRYIDRVNNRGERTAEELANIPGLPEGAEYGRDRTLPEATDIQGQKEWVYTILMRIARIGRPFGSQESYMDAIKISQNRAYLDKAVVKEMDALILLYGQAVAYTNASELSELIQGINAFRADHFMTLAQIPELAGSFRLWEKAALGQAVNESDSSGKSILGMRGGEMAAKRRSIRERLKNQNEGHWTGSYQASGGDKTEDLSEFALMFGEFLWKIQERAAFQDCDRNGTGADGSGDIPLRRLFYLDQVARNGIKEGRLNATFEMAKAANLHQKDWYSELGDKSFWLRRGVRDGQEVYLQDQRVVDWYLLMKKEGKTDEEGRILDMSECPLEYIDYTLAVKSPHTAIMAGHVNIRLDGAEKTRKLLLKSGGILENPTMENFKTLAKEGAFGNLNLYVEEKEANQGGLEGDDRERTLKARDDKRRRFKDPNTPLEHRVVSEIFRQEAHLDLFKAVAKYALENRTSSPETIATVAEQLAASDYGGVFGKKERNESFKAVLVRRLGPLKFNIPHWLDIPFRKLDKLGAVFSFLLELIKGWFKQ